MNSDPKTILWKARSGFVGVGIASFIVNILYLTGSFFMLQVYDRVIPSGSIPTLIALSVLALLLYFFQGLFEVLRSRMLVRIAGYIDENMTGRVFRTLMSLPLSSKVSGDGLQALRDFDSIKSFLSGGGPPAFFDLPWLPFYIGICFLFHPVIGYVAMVGALILILLTFLTNRSTSGHSKAASEAANQRNAFAQYSQRNAEVIRAMGMTGSMTELWVGRSRTFQDHNQRTSDVGNGYGSLSKVMRMIMQSSVLAAGAVLVIEGQASPGIIIAGSILSARALAPVELAIANWKGYVAARQGYGRLMKLFEAIPETVPPMALPSPKESFTINDLAGAAPNTRNVIFSGVNFELKGGNALGIIGPSASGKSSLARVLTGIWAPVRGSVRLDGATLDQWDPDQLGRSIGYLPQDVGLFEGSVAKNISRFQPDATPDAIIAAARAANVHEMILALPEGYDTEIGNSGAVLSAGQRQRVGLARALYGDPFLVVLDEPNSNLDPEGEKALTNAILSIRARNGMVIVIAHRPSALAGTDLVLMMNSGRMVAFGPKDEVLSKVLAPQNTVQQLPVKKRANDAAGEMQ